MSRRRRQVFRNGALRNLQPKRLVKVIGTNEIKLSVQIRVWVTSVILTTVRSRVEDINKYSDRVSGIAGHAKLWTAGKLRD